MNDAAQVVQAMLDMVLDLSQHPGTDKQALDHVMRRMQDVYGSPAAQLARAVERARLERGTK